MAVTQLSRDLRLAATATLAIVLSCLLSGQATAQGGTTAHLSRTTAVVVMAAADAQSAVERAAEALGGRLGRRLGIIHGFAATLPTGAVARLEATPGVVSVTPDRAMHPLSLPLDVAPGLGYDPADTGSLSAVTRIVHAQDAWARGYTGQGIDVAVIDTGVAPVPGLDAAGQVLVGPDLSFDSQSAAAPGLDAYGHGTFMAGIIAGRDPGVSRSAAGCTSCLNSSGYSDTQAYVGVAPDARIVNVKVGAADGGTDVSQVIAAIDWVTQHAHDAGVNIRVLNLSFGTDSNQPYLLDPLAQAAEQAWKHGIVLVAAAGNDGRSSLKLADPAYDPFVIAAGADDPLGTPATSDDRVPAFAQHGLPGRPVDVVAPATHVIGLRVQGSFVDTLASNTGQVGTRFQRGSGTSQAAAVVSGVAALLLQQHPTASPDTIKSLLNRTAVPLPRFPNLPPIVLHYSGHGIVDAGTATVTAPVNNPQTDLASTGKGTLDRARGGVYVTTNGLALTGEKDIFGHGFAAAQIAQQQASAKSWTGGVWNGSRWTGAAWTGAAWTGAAWTGTDWTGSRWTGSRWTGMSWDGSRWIGSGWNGSRWTGAGWDGSRWSSSSWN